MTYLPGGASRLAALLLPQIHPVFSVVAPCRPGAALRDLCHDPRGRDTSIAPNGSPYLQHPRAPLSTSQHLSAPLSTPERLSAPLSTPQHPSAPLSTPQHLSAPLSTPEHLLYDVAFMTP